MDEIYSWEEPAILQASKLIREEASPVYYRSNAFEVSLMLCDMEKAVDCMRTVIARCGDRPFQYFNFYIGAPRWLEVKEVRHLVQLFSEVDLHLKPRIVKMRHYLAFAEVLDPRSIFHFRDYSEHFRRVLEEAVELGKQARTGYWSKDELEAQFEWWYGVQMKSEHVKRILKQRKAQQERRRRGNRGKSSARDSESSED